MASEPDGSYWAGQQAGKRQAELDSQMSNAGGCHPGCLLIVIVLVAIVALWNVGHKRLETYPVPPKRDFTAEYGLTRTPTYVTRPGQSPILLKPGTLFWMVFHVNYDHDRYEGSTLVCLGNNTYGVIAPAYSLPATRKFGDALSDISKEIAYNQSLLRNVYWVASDQSQHSYDYVYKDCQTPTESTLDAYHIEKTDSLLTWARKFVDFSQPPPPPAPFHSKLG